MRIKYTTGLAVAAGLLAMAVGGATIHAAVTQNSTDVPKAIPDNNLAGVNSTLNFTVAGTITDANLNIGSLTHSFDGDIEFRLTRPGGAQVLVSSDCGVNGVNFTNTVFSDEGAVPNCTAAGAPFTGNFQGAPNGVVNATVMTAFDGFASNGVWTLNVADDSGLDTGTLNAWGLTLDGAPPLPVELQKLEVK